MSGTTRSKARPATAADFRAFYGREPEQTVRAWALEEDGEIRGIAGYYLVGRAAMVFSDHDGTIPPVRIWREAVAFMDDLKLPAVCLASEGAGPFLERLGWQRADVEGGEVYRWQQ